MQYSSHISSPTPANLPIFGKDMIKNSTEGFVFKLDKWKRFERFLILGTEGGTYYAKEKKLTIENAKVVLECIKEDGYRTIQLILLISTKGTALRNSPAIFALSLAATHGDAITKSHAYRAIIQVCRTGTHLFEFVQSVQDLRGWSRGLRRGVANWYLSKPVDKLAYQLIKYRQRNGWTHRDVLRLSHPKTKVVEQNDVLGWSVGKPIQFETGLISGFEKLQKADRYLWFFC